MPISPFSAQPLSDLLKLAEGEVIVVAVLRSKDKRIYPLPDIILREGDILLLEGDHAALDSTVARARLSVTGGSRPKLESPARH